MSVVFLLGAGASYGSGEANPYPPPLGAGLISELRDCSGAAARIPPALLSIFEKNFEEGMSRFREERDTETTELLRDMSAYFAQFSPGPTNLYHKFVSIIRRSARTPTIATTNYDLMLEQAITRAGLLIAYAGHPVPRNNISLLKIHGSCNFLPDVEANAMSGVTFSGNGANFEGPLRIARSTMEIAEFCRNQDSLAPAIAVYSPGKKVLFCPSFVARQQEQWREEVAGARRIYVIGMRVLPSDNHIWNVLAQSRARLYYVGMEPNEFLAWAETAQRRDVFAIAQTFADALPILTRQVRD